MESSSAAFRGTRTTPRSRVTLATSVFSNHFCAPVEVECTDLSMTGMFLSADLLLGPGERLLVSFTVPGTPHRIVTDALVVRSPEGLPSGMGLRFDRLSTLDASILRKALDAPRGSA